MFWRKSYSDTALKLAAAALEVVDEKIETDLYDYRPAGVPLNRDWQFSGFLDIFSTSKKVLAEQRTSFNIGVMNGIASIHYDGERRDFDDFLKEAIKIGVLGGKDLVRNLGVIDRKHPLFFAKGLAFSKDFAERHIHTHRTQAQRELPESQSSVASRAGSLSEIADQSETNVKSSASAAVSPSILYHENSASSAFAASSFYRKFRADTQAIRFSHYKIWASEEARRSLRVSEALGRFRHYKSLLSNTPEAALGDQEMWYPDLAREIIYDAIQDVLKIKFLLDEIDPPSEAFEKSVFVGCSTNDVLTKEESFEAFIKKLSTPSFNGFFRVLIWPQKAKENNKPSRLLGLCLRIEGTVHRKLAFDEENSSILLSPLELKVQISSDNWDFDLEKHREFADLVEKIDSRYGAFMPEIWLSRMDDDIPFFLKFAIYLEHILTESGA